MKCFKSNSIWVRNVYLLTETKVFRNFDPTTQFSVVQRSVRQGWTNVPQLRRTAVLRCILERAFFKSDISSDLKVLLMYPKNTDQPNYPNQHHLDPNMVLKKYLFFFFFLGWRRFLKIHWHLLLLLVCYCCCDRKTQWL